MKILLIDLFGTLIPLKSDEEAHRELLNHISRLEGLDVEALFELYRRFERELGHSDAAMRRVYRELVVEKPKFLGHEISYLHTWYHIALSRPYEDVYKAMEMLRNRTDVIKIIVTDASRDVALGIARYWGLDRYFDHILATGGIGIDKKNPALIHHIMKIVRTGSFIVVGDSLSDCILARNMGAYFIAIARDRTRQQFEFCTPNTVVKDLIEAVELIDSL